MFEPRHNMLSNVLADIRKYVVSWLKHLRKSNRPVLGPISKSSAFCLKMPQWGTVGYLSSIVGKMGHLMDEMESIQFECTRFGEALI